MGTFGKISFIVKKRADFWFLISIVFIFSLLRLPSLIEPNWYGDEGIYQVIGRAIHNGAILYRDIWDNKPPLLYLLYGFFNGDIFSLKLLSLLAGAVSVIIFFLISKRFFKKNSSYIATSFYAILFGLPILEGNIANAENFMHLPILLCLLFVLSYLSSNKTKFLILAGFFLSIAFLLKIVAIFDFLAFGVFLAIINWDRIFQKRKIIISKIKPVAFFAIGFVALLIFVSIFFVAANAFKPFYEAVIGENISYVGYENSLIFPMGILIFKSALLLVAIIVLFLNRHKLPVMSLILYLWFFFSIYNAFFSHRPYTHYLLVLLPASCLLFGHMLSNLKTRLMDSLFLLGVLAVATLHFSLYKYSYPYYKNYFQFITGRIDITQYQLFFDRNTPRDYEVASFIRLNTKTNEQIFLWSNSAQIYALSNTEPIGRYVVAYHITFYPNAIEETKKQISKIRPRFIIQTSDDPEIKNFLSTYDLRYRIQDVAIYEREI